MAKLAEQHSSDWLSRTRTTLLAWWMPKIAIFAAIFIAAPFRTAVWTVALLWMGTACFLNSSLRTHSLPLYGPVLFGDDASGACFRSRPNLGEYLRMASALPSHSLWWLRYSMEDRTGVGQVLSLTPLLALSSNHKAQCLLSGKADIGKCANSAFEPPSSLRRRSLWP